MHEAHHAKPGAPMEALGIINLSSVSRQGRTVLARTARTFADPAQREDAYAALFDNRIKGIGERERTRQADSN